MSDFEPGEAQPNSVELLGFYGGDETHAMSAWTSTSRDLNAIESKTNKPRRDRIPALLTMLATSTPPHTSPFEKSFLHFLVVTDKATHIHLLKHRIAVSLNGESARYKELLDDKWFYPRDWPTEEQARMDLAARLLRGKYFDVMRVCHAAYHQLLDGFVAWKTRDLAPTDDTTAIRRRAKETARFALPHASQITQDMSFNFMSFMHFQKLRNDSHAQAEVQEIAAQMLACVRQLHGHPFQHSLTAFGW